MTFTYDVTTDRGKVRLLALDSVAANAVFSDDEIDTFLLLAPGVRLAAAEALETIAGSQALILKVTSVGDVRVDGTAVARELRERAASLRAAHEAGVGEDDYAGFEFAEYGDGFAYAELLEKTAQRTL